MIKEIKKEFFNKGKYILKPVSKIDFPKVFDAHSIEGDILFILAFAL
jgi:hypothetical protein